MQKLAEECFIEKGMKEKEGTGAASNRWLKLLHI